MDITTKVENISLATWTRPELVRLWDWREKFVEWIVHAWDLNRRCVNVDELLQTNPDATERDTYTFSWDPTKGHNCLTLASTSCFVITGVDLHDRFSPIPYTTEIEAYMAMRKLGFKSVDQLLNSLFPEIELNHTLTGDLLTVGTPNEDGSQIVRACAIADPPFFWTMTPVGLGRGRLEDAKTAYAVAR